MSTWQPIETFPKDGEEYLVRCGQTVGIGYWSKGSNEIQCCDSMGGWFKPTWWAEIPGDS